MKLSTPIINRGSGVGKFELTHSFRSHYFHLIWSTKNREDSITKEIQPRLYAYMGGIVKNHPAALLKIGGTANHVHLLICINSLDKFSDLIREIKAKSSLWIRQNYPKYQYFAWQEGYGSFSVSFSVHEKVKKYIENQEEHHKNLSFEEEFEGLLERNNMKYDERFVFG